MRKTISTLLFLAVIWCAYVAWPLYDLFRLARAIENRNLETVTHLIDFVRVRNSFSQQIVESYAKRTGTRVGPRVQGAAFSIADPIVAKFVTAEALAELLRVGWPVAALPDRPPNTSGLTLRSLGNVVNLFGASEYGVGRFEVTVPVSIPADRAFGLELRLTQWRWRLSNVRLPVQITELLVDEIIKSTKNFAPPQ